MGTREVYEEKLRSGRLYHDHDPTMNPGLGSARCPRCLSLLNPPPGKGEWTITPVLHDATAVAGIGVGGLLGAVHSFNTGIPFLRSRLMGPKWLPLVVGFPPLLLFSGAGAAFGDKVILFQDLVSLLSHLTTLPLVLHIMGFHCSHDMLKKSTLPSLLKKSLDDLMCTLRIVHYTSQNF